jgi:hypothetical protein
MKNLLMIIDACRSGHIKFPGRRGGKMSERISLFTGQVDKAAAKSGGGWGAISATASDSFSFESQSGWKSCHFDPYQYAGGLFTCHLLRGLAGKADGDNDGEVTSSELFSYLKTHVTRDSGGHQVPQPSGDLDPKLVLGSSTSGTVRIPQLPEKYAREKPPSSLVPWLWVGGGMTVAALGAGTTFWLQSNSTADSLNAGSVANRSAARNDYDQQLFLGVGAFAVAGIVGSLTLAGLLLELLDQPEGIEDVYEQEPLFEFDVGASPEGAALSLTWTWN